MTVEERGMHGDQFPVGMRVLAVDDDPVCLKLLESLLIRCQYNVTTTGQATTALRLLRENRNKFDLVISDVHMPDMDGFKLLELVGLEMDLPVIMLSANGEKQAVMKGITHGACDYLLKPVRIEELKNVWQHVIRRRRFDQRCQNYINDQNILDDAEDGQKAQITSNEGDQQTTDRNGKLNKKRKDQFEDDEFDSEDDVQDNDDHSSQKRPRVVWTADLHRKFVTAVNQLGIEKAVPKKILDMMNVESLTRENVASHLQKYRLYLKRLSVVTQQSNMASSFGGRGSPYAHMSSLNGFRSYQPLGSSKQLQVLPSFQLNDALRMNGPTSIGKHGFLSSQAVHLGQTKENISFNINETVKFQRHSLPRSDQINLLHGVPVILQSDESQTPRMLQDVNSRFPNNEATADVCLNSSRSGLKSTVLLHTSLQHQTSVGTSPSVAAAASSSNCLEADISRLSQFPRLHGHNDIGQVSVTSVQHSANPVPKLVPVNHEAVPIKIDGKISFLPNAIHSFSEYSNSVQVGPLLEPISTQSDVNSLGGRMNATINVGVHPNYGEFRVEDNFMHNRNDSFEYDRLSGISAYPLSPMLRANDVNAHNETSGRDNCSKLVDDTINGLVLDTSVNSQSYVPSGISSQLLGMDEYAMDTIRLQNDHSSTGWSFDELYALIKLEQNDDKSINTEFGSELYSLGTCI